MQSNKVFSVWIKYFATILFCIAINDMHVSATVRPNGKQQTAAFPGYGTIEQAFTSIEFLQNMERK